MKYKVLAANGDKVFEMAFNQVKEVQVFDGVYYIYDISGLLLFSSPVDSVVYIALA